MVVSKYLITTFRPNELNIAKPFGTDTYVLRTCAAGRVIVEAKGYTSKNGASMIATGPGNVRYRTDYMKGNGTLFTDGYVYNLLQRHDQIPVDSLQNYYFHEYLRYMKSDKVNDITLYCGSYKGNVSTVYIVKPSAYHSSSILFSIEAQ